MKYQVNNIIKVKVTAVEPYGAFVSIADEYKGLIHISEINGKFIQNINEYLKVNDIIYAKILEINEVDKKIKLTLKNVPNKLNNMMNRLSETNLGFTLLADLLPDWINEKIELIDREKR